MTTAPHLQPPCPEWHDLKAYSDGEAPPRQQSAVFAHLEGCSRCAEELRMIREIASGLRQLDGMIDPPADLRQRILSRVEAHRSVPHRRSWTARIGGPVGAARWALAAAAVVVAGVTWIQLAPPASLAPALEATGGIQQKAVRTVSGEPASRQAPPAASAGASRPLGASEASAGAGGAPPPAAGAPLPAPQGWKPPATHGSLAATKAGPKPMHPPANGMPEERGRKVAYHAHLTLRVRGPVNTVRKQIEAEVLSGEGRTESPPQSYHTDPPGSVRMILRVPSERLDNHLQRLSRLGKARSSSVRTHDLTRQWRELHSSLTRFRAQGARRAEAERQLAGLKRRVELATVDLTLIEE